MRLNQTDSEAKLYFYGDICLDTWQSEWYPEDKAPQDVVDFLNEITAKKLIVYINSGGGSVYGGIAIYNILKRFNMEKVAYIDGIAASIASVIPFACDRVIALSGSQIMIHKPWSIVDGNSDDFRKEADALDNCQNAIIDIYEEHLKEGITREQITEMVNRETWMTGAEAAEYFNIEVEKGNTAVASMSDYFDKYKNLPESLKKSKSPDKSEMNQKEKLQCELDMLSL